MRVSLRLVASVFFMLLMTSKAVHAGTPYLNIGLGAGWGKIGTSQYYSPTKGLVNYYQADTKAQMLAPLITLGAGYQFALNHQYYAALGIEGDYIDYGKGQGIEHPWINIGHFHTLSYSYSADSYLIMLTGKLGVTTRPWLPYISFGIGMSLNQLGNYSVIASGSAAPPQLMYKQETHRGLAYSVGVALYQWKINHSMDLSIGYRFIYAGTANLENPKFQNDALSSGVLRGHFLTLSLTIL